MICTDLGPHRPRPGRSGRPSEPRHLWAEPRPGRGLPRPVASRGRDRAQCGCGGALVGQPPTGECPATPAGFDPPAHQPSRSRPGRLRPTPPRPTPHVTGRLAEMFYRLTGHACRWMLPSSWVWPGGQARRRGVWRRPR